MCVNTQNIYIVNGNVTSKLKETSETNWKYEKCWKMKIIMVIELMKNRELRTHRDTTLTLSIIKVTFNLNKSCSCVSAVCYKPSKFYETFLLSKSSTKHFSTRKVLQNAFAVLVHNVHLHIYVYRPQITFVTKPFFFISSIFVISVC